MQTPVRLAAKLFANDPAADVDHDAFIALFHRFIQEKSVPGLLIDVADYAHVPDGPGIILVGHDVEYALDSVDGQAGLLTTHKRHGDADLEGILRETLSHAVVAARAIEAAGEVSIGFDPGRVVVHFVDRLRTPNTPETYAEAEAAVAPVAEKLFAGGYTATRTHAEDARRALAIELVASEPADLEALAGRLGS